VETARFIDMQTRQMDLILLLFAPEHSIATTVIITASFDTRARVTYEMAHFAAVEEESLDKYLAVAACLYVLASFFLMNGFRMSREWLQGRARHANQKMSTVAIASDICLCVTLVVYVALRQEQVSSSGQQSMDILGDVLRIPWPSGDVEFSEKLSTLFDQIQKIGAVMTFDKRMSYFSYGLLCLVLFRFILATRNHPRLALMVLTIMNGIDDFFHFALLFGFVFCAFCALAVFQFGGSIKGVQDFPTAFTSQWQMMAAELPDDGMPTFLFGAYVVTFHFVVYYLLVNFLLAIVVESYMRAKAAAVEQQTEQNFFMDALDTLYVYFMGLIYRWPDRLTLANWLEDQHTFRITYSQLRIFDANWRVASRRRFLQCYYNYSFCKPLQHRERPCERAAMTIEDGVDELSKRVAIMLGQKPPTKQDRIRQSMATRKENQAVNLARLFSADHEPKRQPTPINGRGLSYVSSNGDASDEDGDYNHDGDNDIHKI